MPRSTKPWMAVMETEEIPDYNLDRRTKNVLSLSFIVALAFGAGVYCTTRPSLVHLCIAIGLLGIWLFSCNQAYLSPKCYDSLLSCSILAKNDFKPKGIVSASIGTSEISSPPNSTEAVVAEIPVFPASSKHKKLRSTGALTPPIIPARSKSAFSLSTLFDSNMNDDFSRRDSGYASLDEGEDTEKKQSRRTREEAAKLYKSGKGSELTNTELIELCIRGVIPAHSLEKLLDNDSRAIYIRRNVLVQTIENSSSQPSNLNLALDLPFEDYDFSPVRGRCAENVIGYMPLPVGIAGPLKIDGKLIYLPMATTEGTLIASTSRGCKGLNAAGGVTTVILADGMTRAPVLKACNIAEAAKAKEFIESDRGLQTLQDAFESTTTHGKLLSVTVKMAGSYLYLRFKASTGEAMGMNIVGKGVQAAIKALSKSLSTITGELEIVSLSGNYCSDKKPSAINWIEGRGKSVVAEAVISEEIVKSIFRCSVDSLVALNTSKNYVGSALAGVSAGGFNAHAANIVTALFLATGQDPAQNVESSNCITMMEKNAQGSLQISVSMPSLEVGTIGGGTDLAPQAAMLNLLGVKDDKKKGKGENAGQLACVIAAAVLAGELSLCAALTTGELIKAHMSLNRKASVATET